MVVEVFDVLQGLIDTLEVILAVEQVNDGVETSRTGLARDDLDAEVFPDQVFVSDGRQGGFWQHSSGVSEVVQLPGVMLFLSLNTSLHII